MDDHNSEGDHYIGIPALGPRTPAIVVVDASFASYEGGTEAGESTDVVVGIG